MKDNPQFQLDHQFALYLERVGLKGKKIPATQYREMKNVFFGACGQMMVLLRDEIGALEDDAAMEVMQDLMNQVGNHFIKVSERSN